MIMSSDKKTEKPQSKSEETQSSGDRQLSGVLYCPRCNSPNTKFCYYNNYNLSQPRHFCKACRRYWTKGGALRNVPVGGGCRKTKKMLKSSSVLLSGNSNYATASSSDICGYSFLQGFPPVVDFANAACVFKQFSSLGGISTTTSSPIGSTTCYNLDPPGGSYSGSLNMGFNFSFSNSLQKQGSGGGVITREMGSVNNSSNIASSIQSLSSINQDLHLKLQQQRLAHNVFFGAEDHTSFPSVVNNNIENNERPQPSLFQNLEISKPEEADFGNTSRTEWFFDNSFVTQTNSSTGNSIQNTNSWNNGFQAMGNLNQYSTLP